MSIWPIFAVLAVLALSGWLLAKWMPAPPTAGRNVSLDGLRGYLAFGVFIHHGAIWYYFLREGAWKSPPSNVYANLGYASVGMFFMITGFLFWNKLSKGRKEPIDWGKLYISRFFRLVPVYALALGLLFLSVGLITHFHLNVPAGELGKELLKWCLFAIPGMPAINGMVYSSLIIASVAWSLAYEWLFYAVLPLLGIVIRAVPPWPWAVGSLIAGGWILLELKPPLELCFLLPFGGGVAATYLVRSERVRAFSSSMGGSVMVLVIGMVVLTVFPFALWLLPMLLLAVAFTIIAAGNTFFGVLTWKGSRVIGEMTYSIYLLHGMVLFWGMGFLVKFADGKSCSMAGHWLAICVFVPIVLGVSWISFRFIEQPAMRQAPKFAAWLNGRNRRD